MKTTLQKHVPEENEQNIAPYLHVVKSENKTSKSRLSVKDWDVSDRPREKLLTYGASTLSDAELLAILLGSGTKEQSAVDLARTLIQSSDHNLANLFKKNIQDYTDIKGIGPARAALLLAAFELGRRQTSAIATKTERIRASEDIFKIMGPLLQDLDHEQMWLLLLNHSQGICHKEMISSGSDKATILDFKRLIRIISRHRSNTVVLVHNHPGGTPHPSPQDIELTARIQTVLSAMGAALVDHLIICDKVYYSFNDEGRI